MKWKEKIVSICWWLLHKKLALGKKPHMWISVWVLVSWVILWKWCACEPRGEVLRGWLFWVQNTHGVELYVSKNQVFTQKHACEKRIGSSKASSFQKVVCSRLVVCSSRVDSLHNDLKKGGWRSCWGTDMFQKNLG